MYIHMYNMHVYMQTYTHTYRVEEMVFEDFALLLLGLDALDELGKLVGCFHGRPGRLRGVVRVSRLGVLM